MQKLLRYNSYNIKFTLLMCKIYWILVYLQNCVAIITDFRIFLALSKEILPLLALRVTPHLIHSFIFPGFSTLSSENIK